MAKRLIDSTLEGVAEWLLLQQGCAAAGRLGSVRAGTDGAVLAAAGSC